MIVRRATWVLLPLLLAGCAWFGDDECSGPDCVADTSDFLDTSRSRTTWYCYGRPDGESWDCRQTEAPEKITAIPRDTPAEDARDTGRPVSSASMGATRGPRMPAAKRANPSPQPETAPPNVTDRSDEPDDTVVLTGTRRLLAEPPDRYTVQLIAVKEQEAAVNYARQNGLDDPLYTRINSKGENWYVLLLGIYPDRATAESARDKWMRTRTLKIRPWIRRVGPLQEAARTATEDV